MQVLFFQFVSTGECVISIGIWKWKKCVVLPDAAGRAWVRSLANLLQFDPLYMLHIIMDHLQKSNQRKPVVNDYNLTNISFLSPPHPPSLLSLLPLCVADGGSCIPSWAPVHVLLTCQLKIQHYSVYIYNNIYICQTALDLLVSPCFQSLC